MKYEKHITRVDNTKVKIGVTVFDRGTILQVVHGIFVKEKGRYRPTTNPSVVSEEEIHEARIEALNHVQRRSKKHASANYQMQ